MLESKVSGPRPLTPGEIKSIATRRMQAAARESSDAHIRKSREVGRSEAKKWTGTWARGLRRVDIGHGTSFVSRVAATARHSEVLEGGHGGFKVKVKAKRGLLISKDLIRGSAQVGPMRARRWVERGMEDTRAEREAIYQKWGEAIADAMERGTSTGRVGRGI
jgi:hypothetical protein